MDVAGTGGSDVAGSGGDGLGGGENAGSMAQAGSGGSVSAGAGGAGAGGTGGALAGTGGIGGVGGVAGKPAAGSGGGGAGGMPAAGSGGSGGSCASEYTTASHVMMNVSWAGSDLVKSGSGVVHIWTKTKFTDNGGAATVESMPCGSVLPVIYSIIDSKILPEIPDAAWDNENMPKFVGTATKDGNNVTINPGVALVGLSMSDPSAAWPAFGAVTGVDHDGDTKLGITAIPHSGSGYSLPPVKEGLLAGLNGPFADKLYLATRNVMTLSSVMTDDCPQSWSGTANVTKFDNHVIGCHVKGGGECTSAQAKVVDDNRTIYTPGSATFNAMIIDDDATCADVRAALPID